jgi:ABC-type amino acid transport substrate-binding protein
VEEALNRSGIKSETKIIGFEEVNNGIRKGSIDGSAALWYTEEREQFLVFSAPYLQNRLVVVGRKGADVGMATFAELSGKRVALVGNYAYGSEVNEAGDVILVEGASDQQNLERLLKQEVDYMLVDELLMEYLLTHQQDEVLKYLQIGATPVITRSLHFAIRKDLQGAQSVIDRFNQGILKMISDGSYNRILQLNWIRADIDGDGKMEMVGGEHAGKAAPSSSYDVWFENSGTDSSTNRYYVNGQIYQGWDNIPQQYKVQTTTERPEDLKLMKFSF